MEKEFVPYELAVKLKALGFDEPCVAIFGRNNELSLDDGFYKQENYHKDTVLAPTFSQAFRWFREKYKLHSTITSISQESWQWHITKPGESLGKLYDEDFYTYEEAELACLKRLIDIVNE